MGFITTLGQRHDAVAFDLTLAQVTVARTGPGRPRTRPDAVLADKAYSSHAIRAHLSRRGIKAVIAIKDDQHAARRRKGSRGGRPPSFDQVHYRDRNTVERAVNKLRAPPRRGHPLRQTRLHLPRHHHRRRNHDLAPRPRHTPLRDTP